MYYELRFQKWEEVLALPAPDESLPTAYALWHFGRGVAFAAQKDVDKAMAEKAKFDEAAAKVPPDAMMNLNSSKDLLGVASAMLDAKIADAVGDPDQAIRAWQIAVARQDKLAYDEPPAWFYPMRESLGAALIRDGQISTANEAEQVFRLDLTLNPGNPRSLFGLATVLKTLKKDDEAAKVMAQFKKAWARADMALKLAGL
jgi:tetratricopeptide (TPR) repeat protein